MDFELNDLDTSALLAEAEALLSTRGPLGFCLGTQDSTGDSCSEADMSNILSTFKKEEARKRRKYRARAKNDREVLRCQVTELSLQLSHVKRGIEMKKERGEATQTATYFLWKFNSLQQQALRKKAEEEQRRLTTMVNVQATYIQTLCGSICEQPGSGMPAESDGNNVFIMSTKAALCESYIKEIEEIYVRIDEILAEFEMASLREEDSTALSTRKSGGAGSFQMATKFLLPGGLQQVNNAIWEVSELFASTQLFPNQSHDVDDPNNTMIYEFRERIRLKPGTTVSFYQRFFLRRFIEDGRIFLVWKCTSDGEDAYSGMQSVETGWCRLSPSKDLNHPGTVLDMCQRWEPMHFRRWQSRTNMINEFHDAIQQANDGIVENVAHHLKGLV